MIRGPRAGKGSNQYQSKGASVPDGSRREHRELEMAAWAFDPGSDMPAWMAMRSSMDEIADWRERGFSAGEAAYSMAHRLSPEEVDVIIAEEGWDPYEAKFFAAIVRFHDSGMPIEDALRWARDGFVGPEELAWWRDRLGRDPARGHLTRLWTEHGFVHGFGAAGGDENRDNLWFNSFGALTAREAGVYDPEVMAAVRDSVQAAGVELAPADTRALTVSPAVAAAWHHAGVDLEFGVRCSEQLKLKHNVAAVLVTRAWEQGKSDPQRFIEVCESRWDNGWNAGKAWESAGIVERAEADAWMDASPEPSVCAVWRQRGLTPAEALPWVRASGSRQPDMTRAVVGFVFERGGTPDDARAVVSNYLGDT